MKKTYILLLAVWSFCFCSCGSSRRQAEEASADGTARQIDWGTWNFSSALAQFPGIYPLDEPEGLKSYFESLCQRGAQIWVQGGEQDSLYVWQTIDELDRFAGKLRPDYPVQEVQRCLSMMNLKLQQMEQDLGCLEAGPMGGTKRKETGSRQLLVGVLCKNLGASDPAAALSAAGVQYGQKLVWEVIL